MADNTTEKKLIFKIDTKDSELTIGQLKEMVKGFKKDLDNAHVGTEEGWAEYQETLDKLRVAQNALKDAMYATSGSLDDVVDSANGVSHTYNSLVHNMAELKSKMRNVNLSTDEGMEKFRDYARQIDDINSELKALDKEQGVFVRNVGNYQSAFKGMGEKVDGFSKGLKALKGGADGAKGALDAMSKTPALAVTGLLVSAIANLVSNFKESEQGAEAMEASLVNFKPIMNLIKNLLDKTSEIIGTLIKKVSEFLGSSGLLNKIIDGVVGVGNAIVKYVTAPFKGVIEAIKIFKEQGIKGFKDASKAFLGEMKDGISFKKNFEAGQAIGEALTQGVNDKKPEAEKAGKALAKKVEEGFKLDLKQMKRVLEEHLKEQDELRRKALEEQEELDEMTEEEWARTNDEIENYFQEQEQMRLQDLKDAQEKAEAKKQTMQSVVSATSDILGTLADLYENDDKQSEKSAKKVKALRIAQATINTISGAIGAFTQASETIPPPYGQIVGAVNASVVTATGMAQIAKIKGTSVTGSTGTSGLSFNAPSVDTGMTNVRSITSASEEERLNSMASSQKVYILQSDIEASANASRTKVTETSF